MDILGILVAHPYQYNSSIDTDSVLCYQLTPVSVSLSTPDGSIRKTVKSELFKAAISDLPVATDEDLLGPNRLRTYFLDSAAAVRTIVGKPETVRELAARILVMVPRQYKDFPVICDTYKENSIKGGERAARGTSEHYFLRSPDMNVPHDFARFLRNGSNKEMLFDLIQQSTEEDRANLKDRTVYFFNKRSAQWVYKTKIYKTYIYKTYIQYRRPSDSFSKLKFRPRGSLHKVSCFGTCSKCFKWEVNNGEVPLR